jgi:sec-independent protein translocase protein TatC
MDEPKHDSPLKVHLLELRKRLVRSFAAIFIAFVFTYGYSESLYALMLRPVLPALPEGQKFMAFTGLIEPFFIYLKVGFLGAFVVASPIVIYQVWRFVAPALYKKERKLFMPLVGLSFVLFIVGVSFAYFVVFPLAFKYLLGYSGVALKPYLSMSLYFAFASKLLLAFGLAFQLPLVIMVLSMLGIVTAKKMASYWRYAILASVIVAALLTPPDIFSQILMGVPLMGLYWLGILLASIFGKKKAAPDEKSEADKDKDVDD